METATVQLNNDQELPESEGKQQAKANFLIRFILYHYGETTYEKSPQQISREANLLPGIPFNRWFLIPAALLIQFCCGSLYAWSNFNIPIDLLIYGKVVGVAPMTFYITTGVFGISAALSGPWLERNGPAYACFIGTSLFVSGHFVSALALYLRQMWLVFLGYGVLSGLGIGMCYISPISPLQKFFPQNRGLASGLATCGFGLGSIAISKMQLPLYNNIGLPLTFVMLGIIYLGILIPAGQVLRTPPPNFLASVNIVEEAKKISLIEALKSADFRLLYVTMLANSVFGVLVISRLANMTRDIFSKNADEASTVVSINGLCNLVGRMLISFLSDFVGRKNIFIVLISTQLVIIGCFSIITSTQTYWAFLMTMWILTACYGAGFGVIPAFLSDILGSENIGACHGVILTAYSVASVFGGLLFTAIFNANKNPDPVYAHDPYPYNVNVWWIFAIVSIGWLSLLFVTPTRKDKSFTKWPRNICRTIYNKVTKRGNSFEFKINSQN